MTGNPRDRMLIEAARRAFLHAAADAYEDAGIRGLCVEGRWEAALAAVRALDLDAVLTSMDEQDLVDAGYEYDPHTLVLRRAEQARLAGMGGIVCSAGEAAAARGIVGAEMAVVTPGIRPAGAEHGDQKRVMTPAEAIRAGASHLVVARPIVAAPDRRAAAEAIIAEMARA